MKVTEPVNGTQVLGKDLQLRDEVATFDGAFNSAVVTKITEDSAGKIIHLFRPYVTTSDHEHSGGVTPFIGIEQYIIYGSTPVILLNRVL